VSAFTLIVTPISSNARSNSSFADRPPFLETLWEIVVCPTSRFRVKVTLFPDALASSVYVAPATAPETSTETIVTSSLSPGNLAPVLMWLESLTVTARVPSNSFFPLNVVLWLRLSISYRSCWSSWLTAARSSEERVSLAACRASSRIRWSMECTSLRAPSAVWIMEMPSWALRMACARPRTWARSFSLMASPAASSAARLIRKPLESLSRDLLNALSVATRFRWALSAAMFWLILSPIFRSSLN
jgi:hypothetical protein